MAKPTKPVKKEKPSTKKKKSFIEDDMEEEDLMPGRDLREFDMEDDGSVDWNIEDDDDDF